MLLSQGSGDNKSIIFEDGSSWTQIGDLIIQRGDADGENVVMPMYVDPHLTGQKARNESKWKHFFPKAFPHKCLQVFYWTNDGSGNDNDSDTYHFTDQNTGLENDGFGTDHKHVKYIAFGY